MSKLPIRSSLAVFALVALATLVGCTAGRSAFPSWAYPKLSSDGLAGGVALIPAIAVDTDGTSVMAWIDDGPQLGNLDSEIYWRRYDAAGQPLTPAVRVTNDNSRDTSVKIAVSGGISYLVWNKLSASDADIWWMALTSTGGVGLAARSISSATYSEYEPQIVHCDNGSHLIWYGGSASWGGEIYYLRINDSGANAFVVQRITNNSTGTESHPRLAVNADCSTAYVAYTREFSATDWDIYLVGANASDGTLAFNPIPVATSASNETDYELVVSTPLIFPDRVMLTWTAGNSTASEIRYASYRANGAVCAPSTPVTADAIFDSDPQLSHTIYQNVPSAVIAWQRGEQSGGDSEIYANVISDDCTPTVGTMALISEEPNHTTRDDIYPELVTSLGPDNAPIGAVFWRTVDTGEVWARFATLNLPIGPAELIASQGGLPGDYVSMALAVDLGGPGARARHVHVALAHEANSVQDVYYTQSIWRALAPATLLNYTGGAQPAPAQKP